MANLWGGGDNIQSSTYHSFPIKTGRVKKYPTPLIKIQSLSLSFLLSYIALLNQDGARYTIVFQSAYSEYTCRTQATFLPGIVVFCMLQSDAFVRLQTFLPLVIVIFSKQFGVLRKHCSEACRRRLCRVSVLYIWNKQIKKQKHTKPHLD